MLKSREDAYGHQIHDYLREQPHVYEIVEREDGYIDISSGASYYFAPYRQWPIYQKRAMAYVKGHVLDIGCGAGRVSLFLQEKGFTVMGIDNSPLAVKACQKRGIKDVKNIAIEKISQRLGIFDTIIMYGNNFGLFASMKKARSLLKKMHKMTSGEATIIAETADPYQTKVPEHLEYHKLNKKRGRMAGQLRLRVRYKKYKTPFFDYLLVSVDELKRILKGTGWYLLKKYDSGAAPYVAVIKKDPLLK